MKNILLILVMITATVSLAQDLEKVKGNREVTTEISPIEIFESLEINSDYEVEIVPGAATQIEITTDSNLHQYLQPVIENGKLMINTTARIRSKKEMKFRIIYGPELNKIHVTDDGELTSVTALNFENLILNVDNDAEVYMTANVKNLELNADDSTKLELNLSGDQAKINFKGNANIKALFNYNFLEYNMKDRADARIEGDIKNGELTIQERAELEGKNLVVNNLKLSSSNSSRVEINATDDIIISASNSTEIMLYGSPDIKIEEFSGKAILKKS